MHTLLALSMLNSQPAVPCEHQIFDLPALRCWDDGDAGENPWWRPPPRFDPNLLDCALLRWGGGGAPSPWPPAILKPEPPPRHHWRRVRASWYDEDSMTANGETFKPDGLTFAMRSHHFGDWWEFLNPRNGRIVKARHNDYGPATWTGKEIDLSRGLAGALGLLGPNEPGTLRVQMRRCQAP